jgi:trans-2,3-dihydro-3-hydroxyanthranilate isomerase
VRLEREGPRVSFGWMALPKPQSIAAPDKRAVLEALGLRSDTLVWQAYDNGPRLLCIGVAERELVSSLVPDFAALARACEFGVGVFHYDGQVCKARYFVPALSINEEPATASFAAALAVQLVADGRLRPGEILRILQGVEIHRPSTLYARVISDAEPMVEVGGCARIVARGQFSI